MTGEGLWKPGSRNSWPSISVLKMNVTIVVIIFLMPWAMGIPAAVMNFPDSGVYSLFPNEDLRTGKAIRRYGGDTSGTGPSSRSRFSDPISYRSTGGRVYFDDEKLNFPSRPRGHFDPPVYQERIIYTSPESYPRPPPVTGHSRLPPLRSSENDEPTRVHVFNPELGINQGRSTGTTGTTGSSPGIEADGIYVRPGRLLIPSVLDLREPGPDAFLNHDEFLDYHTRVALGRLPESPPIPEPCQDYDEDIKGKRILFSGNIHGLIPPSTERGSTEIESPEDKPTGSGERSLERIPINLLLESQIGSPRIPSPILESGIIPIQIQPSSSTRGEGEHFPRTTQPNTLPPTETIKLHQNQIQSPTTPVYPWVKKSINRPGQILQIKHKPPPTTSNPPLPSPSSSEEYSSTESETITFPPNTFDDFVERTGSGEVAATKIRDETPLISSPAEIEKLDISGTKKKSILIKRLKIDSGSKVKLGTIGGVEASMTVIHTSGVNSTEEGLSSSEFKSHRSRSNRGIVSRIHAHVSHCPKLKGGAEIICDVHIRKRHGSINPQLTVGWKRKFHNTTKADMILAVNTTLAYIEQDFHEKFNVTLAPGISPMLRSVLSIRHIETTDTGNYECVVDDGQNKLRSDTLLFLCH